MVDIRDGEAMEKLLAKHKEALIEEFPDKGVAIFIYELNAEKPNYISYITNTTSRFLFYLLETLIAQFNLLQKKDLPKQ